MQCAGLADNIIATRNVIEDPDIAMNIPTLMTFVSLELLRRTELTNINIQETRRNRFHLYSTSPVYYTRFSSLLGSPIFYSSGAIQPLGTPFNFDRSDSPVKFSEGQSQFTLGLR